MKTTVLVLVFFLFCAALTSIDTVSADEPVNWAVDVGDEIVYLLERKTISSSFDKYVEEFAPFVFGVEAGQRLIARVDYLMPVLEMVNVSPSDPFSYCTMIRDNDSVVLAENISSVVIPVGIWSMNHTAANITMPEGLRIIDTADQWGTAFEGQFWFLIFPFSFMLEIVYFKANGTLNSITAVVKMSGTTQIDIRLVQWYEGLQTTNVQNDILTVALLTVVLVGICSAVTLIVYYRRHSHTFQ